MLQLSRKNEAVRLRYRLQGHSIRIYLGEALIYFSMELVRCSFLVETVVDSLKLISEYGAHSDVLRSSRDTIQLIMLLENASREALMSIKRIYKYRDSIMSFLIREVLNYN